MFYCWCFFFPTPDLRTPSVDSRETFPRVRKLVQFYNAGPKIRETYPRQKWGLKRAEFGAISDNFRTPSRISPEWMEISKIGKTRDWQHSAKKVRWTWVTNNKVGHVSLDPPKLTFMEDHNSAPTGCCLLFTHAREWPRITIPTPLSYMTIWVQLLGAPHP